MIHGRWTSVVVAVLVLGAGAPHGTARGQGATDPGAEPVETIPVDVPPDEAVPEGATRLTPMVVTGSRIPRPDFETASPMLVISREDAESTGHTNPGELLQELPFAGSAKNRQFNRAGNGQTEFSLRSLDPSRVLILVDGHRWVGGVDPFNTRAVDLNTIPIGVVDRIEILKDGASAIYGADAIAGVVNIVTRRNWVGAEFGSGWRAYEDGENLEQQYHVAYGSVGRETSLLLDLSFLAQADVSAGANGRSAVPKSGTGLTRGSPHTEAGHPLFVAEPAVAQALNAMGPEPMCVAEPGQNFEVCDIILAQGQTITGDEQLADAAQKYRRFHAAADNFNDAPLGYLLTPLERGTLFAQLGQRVGQTSLLNTTALLGIMRTERQLAATPLLFGDQVVRHSDVFVHLNNPFNPFGQHIGTYAGQGMQGDPGAGPGSGIVYRRLSEMGSRVLQRENQLALLRSDFNTTFEFLDHLVFAETGASYSRNVREQRYRGDVDMDRVRLALGPEVAQPGTAEVPCVAPCVPLNLFGAPGSITPAMLDYLRIESGDTLETTTAILFGTLRADLGEAGDWWGIQGGPAGVVTGLEYRVDEFSETPDPYIRSGASSLEGPRQPTSGSISAAEAFAETNVPLFSDRFGPRGLEFMLAGRFMYYELFDARLTGKAGLRYKPLPNLLLRATWSQGFRTPSVTELYLGRGPSQTSATDPCFLETDATVQQHCQEEGVPQTSSLQVIAAPPVPAFVGGNARLNPELADTFTAGTVYSPAFLPGFTAYLDYFYFSLDQYIQFVTPEFALDSCYRRPAGSPRPDTCYLVTRDERGFVIQVDSRPFNQDEVRISGLDIGFDYFLPWNEWVPQALQVPGRVVAQFISQYMDRFDTYIPTGDGTTTRRRSVGRTDLDVVHPRFNARSSLNWLYGPWRASWTTRYIRGTVERCNDGQQPSLRDLGLCSDPDPDLADGDDSSNRLEDVFYHDFQVTRELEFRNAEITFGIWNLFDSDPPVSYSALANSYPATFYRPPDSRAPYLRVKAQFDPASWFGD